MKLDEIFSPELYAQIKARIEAVNAAEPNKAKHVKLVDLSEGGYISADKYNDKTGTLSQQVADLQGQLAQRDTDMSDLHTKLTAAQADASKLSDAQQALAGLQTKYESEKQEWATKIERQAYEYDIRERAGALKFSSQSAKRDFISQAMAKNFKRDGDALLGYDDFVSKYRESDPAAFVAEEPEAKPGSPTIVLPGGSPKPDGKKMSLSELMKAKNENPTMAIKYE